jgi:hypothetical protein
MLFHLGKSPVFFLTGLGRNPRPHGKTSPDSNLFRFEPETSENPAEVVPSPVVK